MKILLPVLAAFAIESVAFTQEKKDDPVERIKLARDRTISANNLKQIALAFHNVESATNTLPRNITDKNGKPLLSWRVAILPYLEDDQLYKQFKLDEPWDSANNKALIEKMPKVYLAPRGKFEKGKTFYQSFAGAGAFMSEKPLRLPQVTDGLSNTFMVVEAGEPVEWTRPVDVEYAANKPLPKLGGVFDGNFNVSFGDGSVRYMLKGVKEETLKKFITINGGETLNDDDLKPQK